MENKTPINPVWTTEEFLKDFEVIEFRKRYTQKEIFLENGTSKTIPEFSEKFVVVIRKLDGQKGTMQLRTSPREYFNFIPDD